MIRRPPRSTLFPTRRSSDLVQDVHFGDEDAGPLRLERMDSARESTGRVDRKSTRLNSSHANISYAVFCLKKKKCRKAQPLGTRARCLLAAKCDRMRPTTLHF